MLLNWCFKACGDSAIGLCQGFPRDHYFWDHLYVLGLEGMCCTLWNQCLTHYPNHCEVLIWIFLTEHRFLWWTSVVIARHQSRGLVTLGFRASKGPTRCMGKHSSQNPKVPLEGPLISLLICKQFFNFSFCSINVGLKYVCYEKVICLRWYLIHYPQRKTVKVICYQKMNICCFHLMTNNFVF